MTLLFFDEFSDDDSEGHWRFIGLSPLVSHLSSTSRDDRSYCDDHCDDHHQEDAAGTLSAVGRAYHTVRRQAEVPTQGRGRGNRRGREKKQPIISMSRY